MAPVRRPGGPREAFRPLQNNIHLRAQASADAYEPAHDHSDSDSEDDDASSRTNSAEMAEIIEVEASCMDTLDHELVTSPIDCFMEICWAEAIQEHGNDLESEHGDSPTLYNEPLQSAYKQATSSHHEREDSLYDLDPMDNQEEKWERAQVETELEPAETESNDVCDVHCCVHRPLTVELLQDQDQRRPSIPIEDPYQYSPRPVYSPTELPPYSSPPRIRSQTPQASLAFWEPHFTTRNPNDTVHGFPSRPARTTKNRRWKRMDILASARAHLSGRFVKSSSVAV